MTDRAQEIEILATRIMGWAVHVRNTAHWTDAGKESAFDYPIHGMTPECHDGWDPFTYCSDSKQLREKLAETHKKWALISDEWTDPKRRRFRFDISGVDWLGPWADTEEAAVAACCVKSLEAQK